jgi:hypothetical protein
MRFEWLPILPTELSELLLVWCLQLPLVPLVPGKTYAHTRIRRLVFIIS